MKLDSLAEEDLEGALKDLQELFGEEKAVSLQKLWDTGKREQDMVFQQARDPEYQPYVVAFLNASGKPTANDIHKRKRECPNVRCLDTAPIHNAKTENPFAHQAYAAQSTRAKHHRLRGLGMAKASGTFSSESKMRSNRRKRFLHEVKSSKALMEN